MHMVNQLRKNAANLTLSWIHKYPLLFGGWAGENWAGPFFPHPDKVKHQPLFRRLSGGGKLLCIMVNGVKNNSANLTPP